MNENQLKSHKEFVYLLKQSPAILALIFVAVIWYILTLIFPPYMFPPFTDIFKTIFSFYKNGDLWVNVYKTTWRVFVAFGTAVAMGTIVGMIMGFFSLMEAGIKPLLFVIQTIASIVWCFFAVIWFSSTNFAVIFVVFIVGFPIITINVWEGTKNIDLGLEDMAKIFGVPQKARIRGIIIPSVLPYIFAGIRSSLSYCWKVAILAELMVGMKGIGYWMNYSWGQAEFTEVYAWVLVMVVLMLMSEYLLIRPLEAWLMRWRPKRERG